MAVVTALIPVFLVIALGVVLKRALLTERAAWDAIEHLVYYVLFPALLLVTTATSDLARVPAAGVGGALASAIVTLSLALLVLKPLLTRALKLSGPAFTSIFQGAVRWNTYVALAIAGGLHGILGLPLPPAPPRAPGRPL